MMDGGQARQDGLAVAAIDLDEFDYMMRVRGWFHFPRVINQPFLDEIRQALDAQYE